MKPSEEIGGAHTVAITINIDPKLVIPVINASVFFQNIAERSIGDLALRELICHGFGNVALAVHGGEGGAGCPPFADAWESGLEALRGERLPISMARLSSGIVRFPRIASRLGYDTAFNRQYAPMLNPKLAELMEADASIYEQMESAINQIEAAQDFAEDFIASTFEMAAKMTGLASQIVIESDPKAIIDIHRAKR